MAGFFTQVGDKTYMQVDATLSGYERGRQIGIYNATSSGNNNVFLVEDVVGDNTLVWTNATGVTEAFGASTRWQIDPVHVGRCSSYLSRGYRMGSAPPYSAFVLILPYGTTAAAAAAVAATIAQKKAAGIKIIVERRLTPPPVTGGGVSDTWQLQPARPQAANRRPAPGAGAGDKF